MLEYGTSRTVVREAVLSLAGRGLVEARPRHRPVVRKPGSDTALKALESTVSHLLEAEDGLKHLFQSRILIEQGLVQYAASQAQESQVASLEAALSANEAAIAHPSRFYETDKAFHEVLYKMPENPIWAAAHTLYVTWLFPKWLKMPDDIQRNEQNYQAHKAIVEAVKNRDPQAASNALTAHLNAAWQQLEFSAQTPRENAK